MAAQNARYLSVDDADRRRISNRNNFKDSASKSYDSQVTRRWSTVDVDAETASSSRTRKMVVFKEKQLSPNKMASSAYNIPRWKTCDEDELDDYHRRCHDDHYDKPQLSQNRDLSKISRSFDERAFSYQPSQNDEIDQRYSPRYVNRNPYYSPHPQHRLLPAVNKRLVDKLDRMKRIANGNGVNQCVLCGAEFGLLGTRSYAAMCHDCRKYVCQRNCGVDTFDSNRQAVFLCKICSETREMWKKSGAWFYHDVPKHVLPEPRSSAQGADVNWTKRPTSAQQNMYDEWDSSGRQSPASSPGRKSQSSWGNSSYDHGRSPGRRRVLPTPPSENNFSVSAAHPRWALQEPESSSDEENQHHKQQQHRQQQPWQTTERIMARSRRFTDTTSEEEEGETHSRASSPRGSVQTPGSNQEPPELHTTNPDSSDTKSVDSGVSVVHSDRSQSVSRPTSLVPSGSSQKMDATNQQLQQQHLQQQQQQKRAGTPPKKCPNGAEAVTSSMVSSRSAETAVTQQKSDGAIKNALSSEPISSHSQRPYSSPDTPSSPDDDLTVTSPRPFLSVFFTQSLKRKMLGSFRLRPGSLGTIEFSLVYNAEAQTLTVVIIRAKNLRAMDSNGFSDPYVKLHLLPGANKSTKLKTRTVRRSLNPEWNEQLVYYGVTEDDRLRKTLRLTVLDEDRFGSDFLGETRVPLKRLTAGREKLFNVYLEKQMPLEKGDDLADDRGKILMTLMYSSQKQILIVGIVRCAELIGMDPNGYSDPYVKLSLKPESDKHHRAKSRVKKRTLNPEFKEEFQFNVSLVELQKKVLEITVWDKDVGKHDDYIGCVQLGINAKGDRLRHWLDCIKNPNNQFQRWHKLTTDSTAVN